jgi:osmotically-inducible protein OsmY
MTAPVQAATFVRTDILLAGQTVPNAGDQKNDPADIKLAARIRRALMHDKTLSVRAHNVTVVVKDGSVTLRGEVNSEKERQAVLEKADSIAGSAHVTDRMIVKP